MTRKIYGLRISSTVLAPTGLYVDCRPLALLTPIKVIHVTQRWRTSCLNHQRGNASAKYLNVYQFTRQTRDATQRKRNPFDGEPSDNDQVRCLLQTSAVATAAAECRRGIKRFDAGENKRFALGTAFIASALTDNMRNSASIMMTEFGLHYTVAADANRTATNSGLVSVLLDVMPSAMHFKGPKPRAAYARCR